jgi:uncharacterized membrane protein
VIWLAPADQPQAAAGAQAGDLLVLGKADLAASGAALCWADAAHAGEERSQLWLRRLEQAVLEALGLARFVC